eukprot:scaffold309034_cov39-Attheya_sp.AAC.1
MNAAVTDTCGVKTTNIQDITDCHTTMTIMRVTNHIALSTSALSAIVSSMIVVTEIETETEI